jgi:predicted transcriptional regulator
MEPMSIRLEPDVKSALQELADADERSLSAFINRVLREYVQTVRGKRGKAKS